MDDQKLEELRLEFKQESKILALSLSRDELLERVATADDAVIDLMIQLLKVRTALKTVITVLENPSKDRELTPAFFKDCHEYIDWSPPWPTIP